MVRALELAERGLYTTDPNPRVFQLGLPGSLQSQMVVVKFGAVVVKGASYAHTEVKITY